MIRPFVHEQDCVVINHFLTKDEALARNITCKCGWPDQICLLLEEQQKDHDEEESGVNR